MPVLRRLCTTSSCSLVKVLWDKENSFTTYFVPQKILVEDLRMEEEKKANHNTEKSEAEKRMTLSDGSSSVGVQSGMVPRYRKGASAKQIAAPHPQALIFVFDEKAEIEAQKKEQNSD